MGKIPVTTLSVHDLDDEKYKLAINSMIDIMIQNPVKELTLNWLVIYKSACK
jgi:hypothetical protein